MSRVDDLQGELGTQQQTITAKIAADTQLIVQRVESNQAVMSGLKQKIETDQGPMEELSKGKRAFVALTVVVGGFVWFVVLSFCFFISIIIPCTISVTLLFYSLSFHLNLLFCSLLKIYWNCLLLL